MVVDYDPATNAADLTVFVKPRDVTTDRQLAETIYFPAVPLTATEQRGCWYHEGLRFTKRPAEVPSEPTGSS